jgi:U3 small nucleolar RNA-associated protein 12
MHVRHDEQALVTGSADKDAKFWSFEWKKPEDKNVSFSSSATSHSC